MGKNSRRNRDNKKELKSCCGLCNEPDEGRMVLCDWCEHWYHFSCVNLSRAPKSELWKCPECEEQERQTNSKDTVHHKTPIIQRDIQRVDTSKSMEIHSPVPDRHVVEFQTLDKLAIELAKQIAERESELHQFKNQGVVKKDPKRSIRNLAEQPTPIYTQGLRDHNSNFSQISFCSVDTNQRTQLELQKAQEEKNLQQKVQEEKYQIEQKYLERKYEILMKGSHRNSLNTSRFSKMDSVNVEYEEEHKQNDDIDFNDFIRRLEKLKLPSPSTEKHIAVEKTVDISKRENEVIKSEQLHLNPKPRLEMLSSNWDNIQLDWTNDAEKSTKSLRRSHSDPNCNVLNNRIPPSKVLTSNNWNVPLPEVHTLTRAQIAARQVVTKDLPIFDGKPEDWLMFHKRYVNSTTLCGYSNGENLDRLQKCLKGDAVTAVRNLLLDAESVPDIINTLELLFGRPELIVKRLLKQIRSMPTPKTDNLSTIVSFALEVQNLAKTIERKGLHQYLNNPILLQELVERLPTIHKVDWARHISLIPDNRVTLITLGNWLHRLMQALIRVTEFVPRESEKRNEKKSSKSSNERINLHQDENEKVSENYVKSESSNLENKCKICSKSCTSVQNCGTFKSLKPVQRWKAMYDNKLCRKCLRRHGGICRVNKECGVNNCPFKHHPLLHDNEKHKLDQNRVLNVGKEIVRKADVSSSHIIVNTRVLLRIVPIKIFGNGIELDIFAFLDDGSTTTLIDVRLADELKLVGHCKDLCLIWSSNIHRKEKNSRHVSVNISSIDNPKNQFRLRDVKTVSCLGIPPQRLNRNELREKFPHLRNVPFLSYENGIPGILIGSNNPRIGIPREIVDGGDFEPIAARTLIGWSVHGPTCNMEPEEIATMKHHQVEECKCQHEKDESLHQSMKDYFSVDNFGVQVPSTYSIDSKDDERALEKLRTFTKRIGERFESGLLWRYDNFVLPESYWMAKRRLECLEKKKPETIKIIDDTIQDYIRKAYARKLTTDEANNHEQRHWYLPIFTVTYPKKPDKHRMVFDAAAKVNGVSLNSMLLKGPDQLVSLVEILRRFREKLYALSGDIREMFPQIKVRPEDQHCQRFLWRNGDRSKDPDVYVMQVLTFGAACSPSIAHHVKNSNAKEYLQEFPRATEAIIKNHYMDDLMDGENSEEELIRLANDVRRIHSMAGFEIRNFLSNSKKVMEQLGSTIKMDSKPINPDKEFEIDRVLGMFWNIESDSFTFSLKFLSIAQTILTGEKLPTKRELLKLLMSIFDPLGLISHYLIHLKIIIQNVWRSKLGWDEPISSNELVEPWKDWLKVLPTVETIRIPRLLTSKLSTIGTSIELHTFVDASENAFGAVTYLRVEDANGVDVSLIGSKSRVAPLKYLSIPRKELQSGLLGSRLAKSIGENQTFKVDKRVFWTDSSVLLSWLGSDQRKYHQFVGHRVGEILENTNLNEWRWVPSTMNVADDLTKWPKYPIFEKSNRWFNGPTFLREHESRWPVQDNILQETSEELKVICAYYELIVSPLFDSTRFSNWTRMVRAVAYAIRFTKILRAKIHKESVSWSNLSSDELIHAENVIYRQTQFEEFPEEMVTLELNKSLDKADQLKISKSSPLISYSPYLDEAGVLRARGRIDYATKIPLSTKRPIIMPRKNPTTKLLIRSYHHIYHHRNHETVVNEIRQRFCIPQLRVALKSIVTNDCQLCKNRRAKPQPPEEGNLPAGRLATNFRPFSFCGIDYFGPMAIIQGRSEVKRWGVIFTCLTIRAIHIEIAYTLNTQSCIKCIRNFENIRGKPKEYFSDCGTTLIGADNELQKAVKEIDLDELAQTFTSTHCKWNYNPPETKHMGGVWERLVRSIKTCLYDIMPMRKPNDEMFRSLLMEVMNVVNSRPLTFVPLDNENDEALTPNHFLLGSSNGLKPAGDFAFDGPILRSEWKEIQRLTDCFWKRFIEEYIPTLTRKTKWFHPVKPLEIGDIVLVIDSANSRNEYPKARVVDRVIGSNNQTRRVRVQFANGSMLWRGAAGVARLDLSTEKSLTVPPVDQTGGLLRKLHKRAKNLNSLSINQQSSNASIGFLLQKFGEFSIPGNERK